MKSLSTMEAITNTIKAKNITLLFATIFGTKYSYLEDGLLITVMTYRGITYFKSHQKEQ